LFKEKKEEEKKVGKNYFAFKLVDTFIITCKLKLKSIIDISSYAPRFLSKVGAVENVGNLT
jgi:hypothetical protein